MPTCVAYGCNNKESKKISGVTYHRFPKDTKQRAEWIRAVRRVDWTPTTCSTLCSEHFKESDFYRTPFRAFLKSNAVPSIFKGYPKWMQKKPSVCCNPVSVSSSLPTEQGPSDGAPAPCIENVGPTNKIEDDQNKPEATPTLTNYGKNDCDKNTVVIVPDTADYKNVLNDHSDANRRIVISDQINLKNRSSSAFARIENVGSTNDEVVVQIKPAFSNYGKKHSDKNAMVIVSDTPNYKIFLNSDTDANRRIVISDKLILKSRSGSSLPYTYQSSSGSTVPETCEQIVVNPYKNDPLLLFDDEFHNQRIKELEEIIKALYKKKKIWLQKIRRMKRKFKNLKREYIRYTKKRQPLVNCNSQPVVHFLSLDFKNV